MSETVAALSDEEMAAIEAQLAATYGAPPRQHPNEAINSLIENYAEPEFDNRNRQIISYEQYLKIKDSGRRMDEYMLRMKGPTGIGLVQASKFHKFWGEGARPLESETPGQEKERLARQSNREAAERTKVITTDGLVIFRCLEKYPGCVRFFDTLKGLQFHWSRDHESALVSKGTKARRSAKANREAAVAEELSSSSSPS